MSASDVILSLCLAFSVLSVCLSGFALVVAVRDTAGERADERSRP